MPEKSVQPELRRDLGVWGAAAIVVGTVIGSGIFLVPKAMVQHVGSPEMVFLVWIFGGILTLFGALTYAELAAMLPRAGGEYAYLREAYGPLWGFIYGWTQTWVAKSASIATIATGFFLYLANFFPALETVLFTIGLPIGPNWGPLEIRYGQFVAMAMILILGLVNYFGVRIGGGVQVALTALKVVLIFAVVFAGLMWGSGKVENFSTSIPAAGAVVGFFAALVSALWAYDGWNNVNMVASEVRQPQRNLPLALIGGTLAVIVIYLATNVAYFYVLSSSEVAQSDRVAAEMMRRVLGPAGANAVSCAALISIFAALNGSILSGSRIAYALAADGLFFRKFAQVSPAYGTPGPSILLLSVTSAVMVLSGRFDELYNVVIFSSWILYAMAAASVIVLRKKRPDLERPYRTLGYPYVPVLFVGVAAMLLIATALRSPRESIQGLAIILVGLPFYFHWKRQTLV